MQFPRSSGRNVLGHSDANQAEFKRLKGLGVVFTQEPTAMGPVSIAVCPDTCGNLIQLYQPPR
jgi:hypothetical protein